MAMTMLQQKDNGDDHRTLDCHICLKKQNKTKTRPFEMILVLRARAKRPKLR